MTATSTAVCYRQTNGFVYSGYDLIICPGHYQGLCCYSGSECVDEQICHDPKNSSPGGSGYYIGLCMVRYLEPLDPSWLERQG